MEENAAEDVVQMGQYIIIERQNYTKIHKLTKKCVVSLGKDEIDISTIVGEPFWSTFKMEPKPNTKRVLQLRKCELASSLSDDIIKDVTSGADNREIVDDGSSQKLSSEEIVNLRASGMSAHHIVTQLVENSKTFKNKTEYSQAKYLKKKEKKYFEYITIKKPTLRLITEIITRQPSRVLGLRMDTVAQLTTLANVRTGGTYILYESGCDGLAAAALIYHIGSQGNLIHLHPSQNSQSLYAVQALNLTKEESNPLISVNIQKFLQRSKELAAENVIQESSEGASSSTADLPVESNPQESSTVLSSTCMETEEQESGKRKLESDSQEGFTSKRTKREEEDEAAYILKNRKADALVMVAREHPLNIFRALIRFVEASRPFVIYCCVREPLQELYCELKSRHDVIALRLTESWLRNYQVLPDRTHPDVNMSGSGGFLLSGILVCG